MTLVQVVVPSRADIPRYRELKGRIENLVGAINGRFTRPGGRVPIHYVFRSLSRAELLAYYRAARIALVTPLKDGMNLVAEEYCACSPDDDGVLVLSEFAGAAAAAQGQAHPDPEPRVRRRARGTPESAARYHPAGERTPEGLD